MEGFKFDHVKLQEAADGAAAIMNGKMQETIKDAYQTFKSFEDETPLGEAMEKNFRTLEAFYNDEFLPHFQAHIKTFNDAAGFALGLSNMSGEGVQASADLGTVKTHEFDAASAL